MKRDGFSVPDERNERMFLVVNPESDYGVQIVKWSYEQLRNSLIESRFANEDTPQNFGTRRERYILQTSPILQKGLGVGVNVSQRITKSKEL